MFRLFPSSRLYDQNTFYPALERDLLRAKYEVIIESPFITEHRTGLFMPTLQKLTDRGVRVIINTRHPEEHIGEYGERATDSIKSLQQLGLIVLFTGRLHRKIVIIDRSLFYEGSLNILSYADSCEIMRRVASPKEAVRLLDFVGLKKYV